MRHELILHDRQRRSDRTGCEISCESVEAHCEEDCIASRAWPCQRVGRARSWRRGEANVVVVVDCRAGCCAVDFVVCPGLSAIDLVGVVIEQDQYIPTSRIVPGGSLSRSSSFESEKA